MPENTQRFDYISARILDIRAWQTRERLFFSRASGNIVGVQAKCIDTICIERLLAPIFC